MIKRICLVAMYMTLATAGATGAPPPGSAVKILSPRFFPGWQARNVCYPFVFFDSAAGHYKMYYTGSGTEQVNASTWDQWVTGFVTSTDTTAWKFPDNYEQVLFARRLMEGDVLNPSELAAVFDSVFASGACVLQEASTFKAWYTGWNGQTEHVGGGLSKKINFRIGYATSTDGTHWTKVAGTAGGGAIVGLGTPGQQDAKGVAHPHVLKIGTTYRMWYEGYDGTTWRLFHASSPDGVSWTKQGVALNPGSGSALDARGLRNPMVIQRKGKYELWYEGQSSASPSYHVLRATSPDATTWTKVSGQVTLHPDTPVSGSERILVDSAIVLPDGSVQTFFAKEATITTTVTYGSVTNRYFHIYTEVVNP